MSFRVLTDTSGNLPKRLLDENQIPTIAFSYIIDGKEYTCTDIEAFDGKEFYERLGKGLVVTTTQITPQHYADFFAPYLEEGSDIIFISMSSGISGSWNSANIAANMLKEDYPQRKIAVIDTKGAALGEGLVALRAAQYRDEGIAFDEAVEKLERLSTRMCNVFTVDDLLFLRRGGRLSNLSALVGTVLNIKPLLKGDESGKIVAFAKIRGRKKAIEALVERYETLVEKPEEQVIGVVHAACKNDADALIELIRRGRPPKDVIEIGYEPVTGCHVGPGTLALFFEGGDDVRTALNDIKAQDKLRTAISSVKNVLGKK